MSYVNYHLQDRSDRIFRPPAQRAKCVIIGGGVHGLGIAHDLSSRGMDDVWLLEKNTFGSGTSCWSTKLIHGGLRYLENIWDWGLVQSSLAERQLLMELAHDLIFPIPLLYPVYEQGRRPAYQIRAGLWLYDRLSASDGLRNHNIVSPHELSRCTKSFRLDGMKQCFQFWDALTDDAALCLRVAAGAHKNGAHLCEGVKVESIMPSGGRYRLNLTVPHRSVGMSIETSAVVLAAGPWSHELLGGEELSPRHKGLNNKGTHLVLKDMGFTKGILMESVDPADGRIFFALPWKGHTLVGTTEKIYHTAADDQKPEADEIDYLLRNLSAYTATCKSALESQIKYVYSGLRWLVGDSSGTLSQISRDYTITTHGSPLAKLWTIYGGKLTGYRRLAKEVADQVCKHLDHPHPSVTHQHKVWASSTEDLKAPPILDERFISYDVFKSRSLSLSNGVE